mmetsp:Transcript_12149/g.29424  ORF Transcript_12149/g.29424 Transcript_12149/m.29424 type:complete len:404 (-) Transcript_12149:1594-2805(-)
MLADRLAPPVSSLMRLSRKGVTAFPMTCSSSAWLSAWPMAASTPAPSASSAAGMGTPNTTPPRPRRLPALMSAAAWRGVSTRAGAAHPLARVKKAGNSSTPYPTTAAPCVSRNSKVRGMSSTDLAPAHTTATGVRPSSVRSADTSMVRSPPRCTPPIPPVTKTAMPARAARSMVAETVVAPVTPRATTDAMSRRDTLAAAAPILASRSRCSSLRPTCGTPSIMAMVAGTAPCRRTTASTSRAMARFCGYGMPCDTMVLSSATTARPDANAAATSAATTTPPPLPAATSASDSAGAVRCAEEEVGCRHRVEVAVAVELTPTPTAGSAAWRCPASAATRLLLARCRHRTCSSMAKMPALAQACQVLGVPTTRERTPIGIYKDFGQSEVPDCPSAREFDDLRAREI